MSDNQFRQSKIEQTLLTMTRAGQFGGAVVASIDGLPLAMVGRADTEMIAAVAASMKDLAERAHRGLNEISLRDANGNLIVSRYFQVDDDMLLLAVQVPTHRPYRRLTNKAIHSIRQVWHY
ncbi:MAG: roadblock/LC7 domain-containing protein [Anaerolineae bacterium]